MRMFSLFVGLFLFVSSPALAFAIGLEVAVGGLQQNPEGKVSYKSQVFTDDIDIENDAKYDDESRFMGRAKVDMPLFIPNIYVMATPMEFEGTGQKTIDFTFGDVTFDKDFPFTSKVTLDHYDAALYWHVPLIETATFKRLGIEFGINARFLDLKAQVNQAATGLSESTDESVVLPMLYVGVQITPVEGFSIEAEGRGISLSDDHYYDLIGRVKVKPLEVVPVFVAAGYRYEDVDVSEADIKADLSFSGPFIEGGLQF